MSQYWNLRLNLEDNTTNMGNADIEGYGQISILLSKYVLKEKGKGLSSNDFTNNDKQKLDSIQIGAERNIVETISINCGTPYHADSNKNINLNVATKTSQLENDAQFAVLADASQYEDYCDSYVGKSKTSFNDAIEIAIGKNSNASNQGIAIGEGSNSSCGIAIGVNTCTTNVYEVNIGNKAKYNRNTSLWEMKTTESVLSDCATSNINGTSLTCLDTVMCNLEDEIQTRCCDDETLQNNINYVCNRVSTIESYIPNQTSTQNQLADKEFVNYSVQSATANFRGNWDNWEDVPTDSEDYPSDYSGNKIPTNNDYLVVQNASDYPLGVLVGTWRFKYTGDWSVSGKDGWLPEYQVNEEPFTSDQLYAINSGITCDKVNSYDDHLSNFSNPHNVTKSQIGLSCVDNTSDNNKCVKDSVCFNGCTYAEACNDIRSGMGTVTGIDVYSDNTCVCTINDTTSLCLGENAFNSTPFTTCIGTVTGVDVYCDDCCLCTIDDNTSLCLGTNAFNSTPFTTCIGTVTGVDVYCDDTCVCTLDDSTSLCLGTNAFNSTQFTTCIGTVTNIKLYCDSVCVCEITSDGGFFLGTNAFNSTSFTTCMGTVTILDQDCVNEDIPIILCTDSTSVGKSNECALTFNPSTGLLCATSFCGNFCGVSVCSVDSVISGCMDAVTSNAVANWQPTSFTVGTFYVTDIHVCANHAIYADGTYANYPMIKFKDGTDVNGNGIVIGGGGAVVIGGGESADTYYSGAGLIGGQEVTVITNDGAIDFVSNLQSGYACRKVMTFNTSGDLSVSSTFTTSVDNNNSWWINTNPRGKFVGTNGGNTSGWSPLLAGKTSNGKYELGSLGPTLYLNYYFDSRTTNGIDKTIFEYTQGCTPLWCGNVCGTASSVACASDSAKLNGYYSSTSATANCIVRRDGNGYICGSYFNSSIGDENINSYSGATLIFSGSDKWFRRTPPSYVWVGCAGTACHIPTSRADYTNGAIWVT